MIYLNMILKTLNFELNQLREMCNVNLKDPNIHIRFINYSSKHFLNNTPDHSMKLNKKLNVHLPCTAH